MWGRGREERLWGVITRGRIGRIGQRRRTGVVEHGRGHTLLAGESLLVDLIELATGGCRGIAWWGRWIADGAVVIEVSSVGEQVGRQVGERIKGQWRIVRPG